MLPEWFTISPATTPRYRDIRSRVGTSGLHTVCTEAHCPNASECWSGGTATFMVLGDTCTRGCRFCAVKKMAKNPAPDPEEPRKLGMTVKDWKLDYVVVTSVCRDDLDDQGAGHFAACVAEIRRFNPKTLVEVLIPDFSGEPERVRTIVEARPDVLGHNIETVERISPNVRDRRASYRQSLGVLRIAKELGQKYTKSAMMLGLGETDDEISKTLDDLREVGTDFVSIGQYLRPSARHAEIKEFVRPERFDSIRKLALQKGFRYAAAGPLVRSSYKAGEYFAATVVSGRQ